ncbi:MAG: hypothetical protein II157_04600 [Bacteroidales bacterium]|nr:hypothetical protein [Bacteroidales bacterium]
MGDDHILSKLDIHVKYSSGGSGDDGGAKADRLTDEVFVPILKRVIDEIPLDTNQHIDSLVVDLPPVSEDDLPSVFEEKLREALSGLSIPSSSSSYSRHYGIQRLKDILSGLDLPDYEPVAESAVIPGELAAATETGIEIETAAASTTTATPTEQVTDIEIESESKSETVYETDTIRLLIKNLKSEGIAETVIAQELSLVQAIHLLLLIERDSLSGELPDNSLAYVLRERISALDPDALPVLEGRLKMWKSYISKRDNTASAAAASVAPSESTTTPSEDKEVQLENTSKPDDVNEVYDVDESGNKPIATQTSLSDTVIEESSENEPVAVSLLQKISSGQSPESIEETADSKIPERGENEEYWKELDSEKAESLSVAEPRYFIKDAGLTLLHPFIVPFLQRVGLVKKGGFVSPEAQVEAAHLLRELAYPGHPHYNHNLLMEKVLCGLSPFFTIPEDWEPTDKMKEESEALLKAVCEHWKPLSKSSANALRMSFLQREGSLELSEGTWIIRVAGSAIDILLDELPWELSFIILPWNEKPILVEWQQESF